MYLNKPGKIANRMQMPTGKAATIRLASRWLWVLVALLQCSCQSMVPHGHPPAQQPNVNAPAANGVAPTFATQPAMGYPSGVQQAAYYPPSLPPNAWTGEPGMHAYGCADGCGAMTGNAGCENGQSWQPAALAGPWPYDEYIFDGGDHQPSVEVMQDWSVLGLDEQDTVAHYDTLQGRTEVEPANRVPIYSPRFAAVRQVSGIVINRQRERSTGFDLPTGPMQHEDLGLATTVHQPIQAERYLGLDGSQTFRDTSRTVDANMGILIDQLTSRFKAYEDFQIIRAGIYDATEKARLANSLAAAHAWTSNQEVQVILDDVKASLAVGHSRVQSVYEYEIPDGKPRLRIVKVASRQEAQPGDEIEFTIRFDS